MRKTAIYFAAITLTCFSASLCSAEISWESKLRSAHAKAKKEQKLMLLHFYSDNCVWCDRLEAGAFKSNSVAQAVQQGFIPVKIHGGKNPKLAKMFKVSKYPTDVIVTTDGKALAHSVSPQAPDRYIAMLGQARASFANGTTMLASKGNSAKTPVAKKPAPQTPVASKQVTARQATAGQIASAPPTYAKQAASMIKPPAQQVTGLQVTGLQVTGQQVAQAPAGFGMPTGTAPAAASISQPSPAPPTPTSTPTLPVQIPSPGMVASSGPSPAELSVPVSTPTAGPARGNQFVLPSTNSKGVEASLAGARTDGMSLSAAAASAAAAKTSPEANKPELAMQGFCPVSVIEGNEWVEGKPELGVIHLGKLYLFASQSAMDTFLADPIPFTPMLNGIDVVRFFEEKKIVQGRREWGVVDQVHNRMFFFADEAAMNHFTETFENYLDPAMEVMEVAVKAANPGA